jgi:predicted RNase H-like nuclease (RuvC/YqgF family)
MTEQNSIVQQQVLADGTIIYNRYEGEWETIKWLFDCLDEYANTINALDYRLNQIEKRLNIHTQDRKTILNILKNDETTIEGFEKYLSNLSQRTVTLEESSKSNNNTNKDPF